MITVNDVKGVILLMRQEATNVQDFEETPRLSKRAVELQFINRWGIPFDKALEKAQEQVGILYRLLEQSRAKR